MLKQQDAGGRDEGLRSSFASFPFVKFFPFIPGLARTIKIA
jgi:hypothetical protein